MCRTTAGSSESRISYADAGSDIISESSVYSARLPCLFPSHQEWKTDMAATANTAKIIFAYSFFIS